MIKIIIYKDEKHNIFGLEVSGHANFDQKGKDIVCAGVSALTYTLINSMDILLKIHAECKLSNGYIKYILPKDLDVEIFEKSQLIFNTIIVGFKNMKESYSSYIEVIEEEV